jgi:hypothetical protein
MSGNRLMPLAHPLGEQSEREAAGLFWTLLPDGSMWNGSRQRR